MLYNQPYGVSDTNAPYVNGDPSIGRAGSIPPAASIEYDQREIVAVIKWASDHGLIDMNKQICNPPTNADLQQLLKAIFGIVNSLMPIQLLAPISYYVDVNIGNDTTYDGSQATVSGTKGPFKTIPHALAQLSKINLNGFNFNVYVADGVYNYTSPIYCPLPNGSGAVVINGNQATPSNCQINNTGVGSAWRNTAGGAYSFVGFQMSSTAPDPSTSDLGCCFDMRAGQFYLNGGMRYGPCPGPHIVALTGAQGLIGHGNHTIYGGAQCHIQAGAAGSALHNLTASGPDTILTIANAVNITYFVQAYDLGQARPQFSSITNPGNVTGQKFISNGNAIIQSGGRGASYLPGTIAGTTSTGGQYL